MATRLTEYDQLIIEPEKDDYQLLIFVGIFMNLVFWVTMYLINLPLKIVILYILLEIYVFLGGIVPRYSKYILDSRGITKRFLKFETTFFGEQFETKRIERVTGEGKYNKNAIFSVKRVERPKWYNPLYWCRWEYLFDILSWNFIKFDLNDYCKGENKEVFLIGYDLFVQKMKDWKVDVPYVPWPDELRN